VQPSAFLLGQIERLPHGLAADLARHQRHVRHAGPQGGGEDTLLVVPVRGDDDSGIVGAGFGLLRRARLDRIAQPPGQIREGSRDRGGADHPHGRGWKVRLEEDLQRAAAETWVLDRDGALGGLGLALGITGQDAEQQRVA
jgi:hypothetical protein